MNLRVTTLYTQCSSQGHYSVYPVFISGSLLCTTQCTSQGHYSVYPVFISGSLLCIPSVHLRVITLYHPMYISGSLLCIPSVPLRVTTLYTQCSSQGHYSMHSHTLYVFMVTVLISGSLLWILHYHYTVFSEKESIRIINHQHLLLILSKCTGPGCDVLFCFALFS